MLCLLLLQRGSRHLCIHTHTHSACTDTWLDYHSIRFEACTLCMYVISSVSLSLSPVRRIVVCQPFLCTQWRINTHSTAILDAQAATTKPTQQRLPNLWHVIVHSNYLIILLRFQLSRYLMALILHMKSSEPNANGSEWDSARKINQNVYCDCVCVCAVSKNNFDWSAGCAVVMNCIYMCDKIPTQTTNNNTIKLQ